MGVSFLFHTPFTESTFIEEICQSQQCDNNGFISAKDDANIHPKLFCSGLRTLLQSQCHYSVLQFQNIVHNFSIYTMKQV